MSTLTDPLLPLGIAAAAIGLILYAQARLQTRLLQRRLAAGLGSAVVDPATGLFSAAAARQCIRAEANRANRIDRPLRLWIGDAEDAAGLDASGRELAFAMPRGATGVRVAPSAVCVVSCADTGSPEDAGVELRWRRHEVRSGPDAADEALAWLKEAIGA